MNTLFILFAGNVLPVVAIITVGLLLERVLRIDPRPLAVTVFYGCTPVLVYDLLIATHIELTEILRMMMLAVLLIACIGALSWLVARVLRLESGMASAFILPTAFMNSGNYGLAICGFAFGADGLALASLFYLGATMLMNSLGVFVASSGRKSVARSLLAVGKIPAPYSVPIALLVRTAGIDLPPYLSKSIDLVASTTVPLMLLVLGMQISHSRLVSFKGLGALSAGIRLLISPLLALLLTWAVGLVGVGREVAILEAAMPSAVLTSIIASEFGAEPEFVSSVVLIATLLSPVSLTALISILQ